MSFGYVYDERMLKHDCQYDKTTMAECPKRIRLIHQRLQDEHLLDGALKIEAREADDSEIRLNHPQELIDEISRLESSQCEHYCKDKELLWVCEDTNEAARVAIGGCIELVKAAVDGRVHNGFAIVRPPGHHSFGITPQGYCIFNNVAIAAKFAIERLAVERLAIVDFDVHTGNGTYESVRGDARIHLTSLHAYHYGACWPFGREYDYTTKDANTLFVPLNGTMNSEGDFVSVFHHVLLPMLTQFQPQLILISAGFDAGYYDSMMDFGQAVKAHGYGHMSRLLADLCPGRTVAILEGGYHDYNYTECAAMLVRGLRNQPLPRLHVPSRLSGALLETTWNILSHHSKWYPALDERLRKLEARQKELGLAPFAPNQTVFLGDKMRRIYDDLKKNRLVRTREWFPELNAEQVDKCKRKIDEYKSQYEFTSDHPTPSEEQLLAQCTWDEESRSHAFLQSAPFATILVQEFNDFVEGRRENMLICDRELYREAVEKGTLEPHTPIPTRFQ